MFIQARDTAQKQCTCGLQIDGNI